MNAKETLKLSIKLLVVMLLIIGSYAIYAMNKIKNFVEEEKHTIPVIVYQQVEYKPITSSISKPPKDMRLENLIEATIILETGNRTHPKFTENYNHGGIKCYTDPSDSDGFCKYETEEQGYNDLKELLISYVSDLGYDYRAIRNKYCPIVDDGCIGDYERFMEVLEEVERRS